MDFHRWKEEFSFKHISEQMRRALDELKEIEQYEVEELEDDLRYRRDQLIEFRDLVEDMLVSEWKWFLYQLDGHGGGYCYA